MNFRPIVPMRGTEILCDSILSKTSEKCGRKAMIGHRKCHLHQGNFSNAGPNSPAFRSGRYSAYLPKHLIEQYEASINDDELLALRAEIALIDARVSQLVGRLATNESGSAWERLTFLKERYYTCESAEQRNHVVAEILGVIESTPDERSQWEEIGGLIMKRTRVAESERKRMVDAQMMIEAPQAITLVAAIADSVRRHVQDKETLDAIVTDIKRIAVGNSGRYALGESGGPIG